MWVQDMTALRGEQNAPDECETWCGGLSLWQVMRTSCLCWQGWPMDGPMWGCVAPLALSTPAERWGLAHALGLRATPGPTSCLSTPTPAYQQPTLSIPCGASLSVRVRDGLPHWPVSSDWHVPAQQLLRVPRWVGLVGLSDLALQQMALSASWALCK